MTPKPPAPSDLADKFMLRLPDGMRDRLKDEAAKNNRSMNAEIVARLEQSLVSGRGVALTPELEEIVLSLHSMLVKDPRIAKDMADKIYGKDENAPD